MNADALKDLMDAIEKLLGGEEDDSPEEEQDDDDVAPKGKKKGKSLTVISISKGKPGALKIPKTAKKEEEGDE